MLVSWSDGEVSSLVRCSSDGRYSFYFVRAWFDFYVVDGGGISD